MIKYDDNVECYHIKLVDDRTVRKEASLSTKESFDCLEAIISHFISHPDPMVVPVYDFKVLERPKKSNYGVFIYQYDMKQLGMLSEDEKNLIYYMKSVNFYGEKHNDKLAQLSLQYPELSDFMKEVYHLRRYTDCHGGNFLKDEDESYKIIDLEGFIHTPLNRKENDWITR